MNTKDQTWRKNHAGIYHLAGNGSVTRFEWAKKILQLDPRQSEQLCSTIQPANSDEFETVASRPENSALDCSLFQKTFSLFKSDWLTSLELAMSSSNQR